MEEYRQAELKKIKEQNTTTGEGANDENYDPYQYRATPNGTNFFETTVHVIKASLGSGLLAMPSAFKQCGVWGGIMMTIAVGGVCTYTIHLLHKNQFVLCQQLRVPYLSFPVSMKAAALVGPESITRFANFFEFFIEFFIVIYQTGISCVYIIFVSENFKAIMDRFLNKTISVKIYMLYLFFPFMLMLTPPNLKVLAPISLLANLVEFIIFFIILYHLVDDLPPFSTVKTFGSGEDWPIGLGTILFSSAAIGAVATIEKSMKDPVQFSAIAGALNIAMLIIIIIYLIMGFFGFWKYGDATLGSITLNLQEKLIANVVQGMAMFTIYLSFGLNAFVPVEIIWSHFEYKIQEGATKWIYNYLLRLIFVIIAFILALSVPFLELCISLLGAFCMSLIQVVIPPMMDICITWPTSKFGPFYWRFIINIALILFGFLGLFSGTYTGVLNIVHSLKTTNDTLIL